MTMFMKQALVFMISAMVFVPIFKRLGFGSVLGYLMAGVIVGPYGLELIHDAENVTHFSEFGVIFLLFVIGLEIQPRRLWSMRRDLILLGGFQVVACAAVFSTICYLSGLALPVSIVIGFALSLSSTAFSIQTMLDKNLFQTDFGRTSFSILLAQDLFAIPALAMIPVLLSSNVANAHGSHTSWWVVILVILGVVLASRYLLGPVFRLIAETRSREVFTAATLFIVVGVAALMQEIGLSSALGAFLAGVMLADSEYRHELETNIDPFKGLFMGLFFIAVGMGVDLDIVFHKPHKLLMFAVLYLFIKAAIIYAVAKLSKKDHQSAKLTALYTSQGGEFAFVIFGLLTGLSVVPASSLAYLTVIITLSMAVNPIFIMLNEKYTKCKNENDKTEPKYDQIDDESAQVIIAGFGRFGQIFGRILRAQQIPFVAIDHDAAQIELLRKFGNKVYYGDASRSDLLEMAGASKAKYFILAVDDMETSLKTAKVVRSHFPHLKVFARARNRGHAFELMDLDIHLIKRETIDSSMNFVRDLLLDMGYGADKANKIIKRFHTHDEEMLLEQYKVRDDDKTFVSVAHQGTAQLAQVLLDDANNEESQQRIQ
ncbi:MAG: cation:proton antiporter [Bacteriovoracaceae bacterium]|nr:cation:proton antiporter [Bacteriovoracaceae bacterium]